MPDPIAATPEVAPQTQPTATPVTPSSAPVSPNQAAREEIYARLYGGSPAAAPAPTPAEPPAQGETPAVTVVEPSVEPPPESTPSASDPQSDLAALIAATVEAKITETLAKLQSQPAPPTPPTQSTSAPPPAPSESDDWLALLQQGKRDEAEAALARTITARAEAQQVPRILEAVRVEQEINTFITDLRRENPDLAPFEELMAVKAQAKLEADKAAGKIRSNADFLASYKSAVTAAANDAKQLIQSIRGAGKAEAMRTRQEVLSTSTLPPQPVTPERGGQQPQAPPVESAQDYLARRVAWANQRKGLGV